MFCRDCGSENPDNSKFCEACGQAFSATSSPGGGRKVEGGAGLGALAAGARVGGTYEVKEVLGDGGMGTVYLAHHVRLGHAVAVKVLAPNLARDPGIIERFEQEAQLQANLRHPNIIAAHDFITEDGVSAFVMEYVEGRTLEEVIRHETGPIPFERCLELFLPVLDALAFAHSQGIVHRDIKPSNIMLATVGGKDSVKVMDFGIAKALGGTRRTATGTKMGTLHYMSPEQCKGLPDIDHRTDIYSLGATLFEMATGRVPFDTDSEYDLMTAHLQEEPPPPSSIYPGVVPELEAVILTALAKDRDARFQSAEEFAAALHGLVGRSPVASSAPAAQPAEQAKPIRRPVASRGAPAVETDVEPPAPTGSTPPEKEEQQVSAEAAASPRVYISDLTIEQCTPLPFLIRAISRPWGFVLPLLVPTVLVSLVAYRGQILRDFLPHFLQHSSFFGHFFSMPVVGLLFTVTLVTSTSIFIVVVKNLWKEIVETHPGDARVPFMGALRIVLIRLLKLGSIKPMTCGGPMDTTVRNIFWGMLLLASTSFLAMLGVHFFRMDLPMPVYNPVKLLGLAGTLVLSLGLLGWRRRLQDLWENSSNPPRSERFVYRLLFVSTLSGLWSYLFRLACPNAYDASAFANHYSQAAKLTLVVYFVHLVSSWTVLAYWPFTVIANWAGEILAETRSCQIGE